MIDEAKIYVKSGDGGPGIVHFHREKFVSRGGPDGGDGGRGGNVILVAKPNINTLIDFTHQRKFIAVSGKTGGPNNMTGASGDDIRIKVPVGTVVYDEATGAVIADLVRPNQEVIAAKGGRGGRGNPHWKSASNQSPHIAEKGFPGEEKRLRLELRLIADVGIVGIPNAGKSTLLSVVSNAKPKIAAYPFTTLEPNLGVVIVGDRDFVVADIPGLVEGAHMGVGLGHSFLRHVQRTRVLIHLLDGSSENPLADFNQINAELALFDEKLAQKPQLVVLNKMDLPEAQEKWPAIQETLQGLGYDTLEISGLARLNTQELMNRVAALVANAPQPETVVVEQQPVYKLDEAEFEFSVTKQADGSYLVLGENIERAAKMTYWEFEEAVERFQRILAATGITKALEEAGVQVGDTVFIGDHELEWAD
ncbi:MAG: GTPase ObgE [Anaerolineae bacterium]|nr:GTPase ObgE [Anaerolineae bacterium]